MRRLAPLLLLLLAAAPQDRKPNIVLVITDDQGYGDLGCHGNKGIRTPNLDKLAKESFQFSSFHVSPVCSPTRSSLLTGRYNYRTGIVDTFIGRSMMHADEVTLAESLAPAGYRTGIFGKWHLGDNYPLRAMDQGFQDSVTIRGGGLGQPSDPPGGDHYTDATMYRNGKPFKSKGYCSDVFTDEAMAFIAANKDKPFLAYIPFNAPHTPLEVPESYLKPYQNRGLNDVTARVYGMVTNIDDNVGRLLAKLDELKLADNTIVIFMTDNGPQQERYNAGMRGLKGTVYEGGIRVPFFLRWPALRQKPRFVPQLLAHIDVTPTLLEACGVAAPKDVKIDGRSFLPLLKDEKADGPERVLFFQWHRGDVPETFRSCAARDSRWKAVWKASNGKPELFDLTKDETTDVSADHADVLERLGASYKAWYLDMKATRQFERPRIVLDPAHEDPVLLSRQEWRGPNTQKGKNAEGYWEVTLEKETAYEVTLHFRAPGMKSNLVYSCGVKAETPVEATDTKATIRRVVHPPGAHPLGAILEVAALTYGVEYVELKKVD